MKICWNEWKFKNKTVYFQDKNPYNPYNLEKNPYNPYNFRVTKEKNPYSPYILATLELFSLGQYDISTWSKN